MTDKPTPTDAELDTILCKNWQGFAMQSTLVKIWVRDALQDAIDKLGQPDQKTVTVVPATGDVWLKHDDDLRYVRRVLEAGRQMTDVDQGAAIDMVQALRVTSAINGSCDAKKPAQAASSAVLKAIREANMQLVRTGDDALMLVPYKAAKAQAAEPVAWLSPWRKDQVTTDYDAYGKQGIPLYAAPQPSPTTHPADSVLEDAALQLIADLVRHIDRETCTHEETHRGGAIWEICNSCGSMWEDDKGGKPEFKWPDCVEKACAFLDAARKQEATQ